MAWVGRLAVRFRYPVIATWILATIFCVRAFPSLGSIVNNDTSSFLQSSVSSASNTNLLHIVPVVLLLIAVLLGMVLRSLVAPSTWC